MCKSDAASSAGRSCEHAASRIQHHTNHTCRDGLLACVLAAAVCFWASHAVAWEICPGEKGQQCNMQRNTMSDDSSTFWCTKLDAELCKQCVSIMVLVLVRHCCSVCCAPTIAGTGYTRLS
jgi:hypothetical protein